MSIPVIQPEDNDIFSFRFIFSTARRYWLWILAAALLGGTGSYFIFARQGYLYEKTARIMLRDDKQKNSQVSEIILSDLGVRAEEANLANESYVVQSSEVMGRVVKGLELGVSYWEERNIRKVELYHTTPLKVEFGEEVDFQPCSLAVTPLNGREFSLSYREKGGKETALPGKFGIPLELPFATVTVRTTSHFSSGSIGRPIFVERLSVKETCAQMLGRLSVTRPDSKESSLLELTLRLSHPQKAEDVLNYLIEVYNDHSRREKQIASTRAEDFIVKRIEKLGGQLGGVDKQVIDYKRHSRIVKDMSTTLEATFSKLQEIGTELFSTRTELSQVKVLAGLLAEGGRERDMIPANIGIQDAGVAKQIELFNDNFLQYKKLSASAGKQNPMVSSLAENMKEMRESIVRSISNYCDVLRVRMGELERVRDELNRGLSDMASKDEGLVPLLREQKVMEELYLMLLKKREENALALATTEPSARILEPAFGSNSPVAPKLPLMTLGGMAGGAFLCLLSLMVSNSLNTKVKDKNDLVGLVSLPLAGELPLLSGKERKKLPLVVINSRSFMEECFHILRNNTELLLLPNLEKASRVVFLTSTRTGEGKTFTALNLAAAYAQTGKKVLLIDGDLRKASLSAFCGGKNSRGLAHLLMNPLASPDSVLQSGENFPGFDIVPAGPVPPNPAALLTQGRFEDLIRYWRTRYDRIIVDGCPYEAVADASLMARHADLVLYLIRCGMIEKQYVPSIQELAARGEFQSVALILNAENFKNSRFHYYSEYSGSKTAG